MANALWQASRAVTKTNCEYMHTLREQRERETGRFYMREREVEKEAENHSECMQIAEKQPSKSPIYDLSEQQPSLAIPCLLSVLSTVCVYCNHMHMCTCQAPAERH